VNTRENRLRLNKAKDFDQIFEIVKDAVERATGMHRAGLSLVLGDIPNNVGAYHEISSNTIVMNRNLLKILQRITKSRLKKNSYIFMVLMHEYLHSLGIMEDSKVRQMTREISSFYLGERHVAALMAVRPLDEFFPELPKYFFFRDRGSFETVKKFDSSSVRYVAWAIRILYTMVYGHNGFSWENIS
jgi:hypothetical protein